MTKRTRTEAVVFGLMIAGSVCGLAGWFFGGGLPPVVVGLALQVAGLAVGLPGLSREMRYDAVKLARLNRDHAAWMAKYGASRN